MNEASRSFSIKPLQLPSGYSIFKRIANLALVVVGIIICVNLWLVSSEQANNWHDKQANQLGKSLSALSASILTLSLLNNDSESLAHQLNYIVADSHVLGASLYDAQGRLLAENNAASSVVAAYKLSAEAPLVFVKKIYHQEQVIGYLQVMLEENEVMLFHTEYQEQLFEQLQMLMALAAVAGILLTRAFYTFRYRQIRKQQK